ncbi:hypothetical protein PWG71_10170 [Nocardiopsis sp. N85]|uniref:hypothetical protein n=1 Tax=Nocardiopsis sp. N85 TaxID=3029400 RepID=UPI00237F9898|nr:hypothetical protein [Nocardiopsis sp. N85]MDE3721754.1 hypothetical protein [Nocardiopsis sp. N85]
MIPILIALVGVVLLAVAAGFLLAISIGIRRQDNRGSYRSLREEDDNSALSRTGSLVVGLRFANTAPRRRVTAPPPATGRDRTPTTV